VIRVGIVDDHPIVRDGLAANLRAAGEIDVAAFGSSTSDALALAGSDAIDLLVLDLELGEANALDLIRELKRTRPSLAIVVFSAYAGEERVARAFENGADSYVLKGTPSDELVQTIRSVHAGRAHIPDEIAATLARATRAPRGERLTEREREILGYVAEGLSNKAIAERAGISERTVKFHVTRILARLGTTSRSGAIALARRRGLL